MCFSVNQLIYSLNNNSFIPHYQPIVSALNGKTVGYEVLARWKHSEKGLLNASCFVKNIESNNLANALTRSLMADVFSHIKDISIPNGVFLMLNISLSQIMDSVFCQYLIMLNKNLKKFGINLVYEITERESINNFPRANIVFPSLIKLGMKFAIDDFGTGYSDESLIYMTNPHFIKIDKLFTAAPDRLIINKIQTVAHKFGARIIAEGVESAWQAHRLQEFGVDYLQGYFYGKPSSAEDIFDW